ncbi:MAG: hypothetical protein H0V29_04920 [Thermoleophilaceae bacterium]|nr:hypothetical protein [Thermoleophilaceae bacterium]
MPMDVALGANFDLIFAEFTDRDAGYARKIDSSGCSATRAEGISRRTATRA